MLFHEFYIYIFTLFCSFSILLRSEIDISSEIVTYFHRVWFQNWICDILERYNDSSDLFIVETHLCRHTFILRKDKCYRQEISERCKVGQYFLTNFLNFSATHHSRWKESLFVTDIFLLSCVHFVILFPTCKKVCVRCYTCLWAYFYFYKWQNPFYDRVTF